MSLMSIYIYIHIYIYIFLIHVGFSGPVVVFWGADNFPFGLWWGPLWEGRPQGRIR